MAHAGKVLLKIVANRLGDFCKEAGILPEEQRLPTPTLDNRYDVRRAQTSGTGTGKQRFLRDLLHRSGKSIRLGRSCAIMRSTCPFWSSASDDEGHPQVSRWYEGSRTVGRWRFLGVVQCLLGAPARMCVVAAIVQYLLCGGHHSGSAEVCGGPADRFGLRVPR